MVRGIRGAITVEKNTEEAIVSSTAELLKEMANLNDVNHEDIAHLMITVTEDLNNGFPAQATRSLDGWSMVPVMCAREIPVPNSMEKCIRVMMTVNTAKVQSEIKHAYLRDAEKLRPDLNNR